MATELLDRVKFLPLRAKQYERVYDVSHGAFSPNPDATGRFALKDDMPRGAKAAGAWYISDSTQGALWETVLRKVKPDSDGGVTLPSEAFSRTAIQSVTLNSDLEVLRLEPAMRRHVVAPENDFLNGEWEHYFYTTIYEQTHCAAGMVSIQCSVAGMPLPGMSWRSKQADSDLVYVLYDPPWDAAQWSACGQPVVLSSRLGQKIIHDVLGAQNMTWLNPPAECPELERINMELAQHSRAGSSRLTEPANHTPYTTLNRSHP